MPSLFRIVREFHRRPSVDRRHLADDRDRIEIGGTIRRAADKIIGEVGAPAKADADAAGEMAVGFLDRADIHAVGKHQESFPTTISERPLLQFSQPRCWHKADVGRADKDQLRTTEVLHSANKCFVFEF